MDFEVTKATINGIHCIVPIDDQGSDFVKKMGQGDILPCKIWKPRNYGYHRKYMAMIKYLTKNCDKYNCDKAYIDELKLRTGHYDMHITSKGVQVPILKSMSFAKMDQVEFEKFFSKCIDVILQYFIPGNRDDIVNGVLNFL